MHITHGFPAIAAHAGLHVPERMLEVEHMEHMEAPVGAPVPAPAIFCDEALMCHHSDALEALDYITKYNAKGASTSKCVFSRLSFSSL